MDARINSSYMPLQLFIGSLQKVGQFLLWMLHRSNHSQLISLKLVGRKKIQHTTNGKQILFSPLAKIIDMDTKCVRLFDETSVYFDTTLGLFCMQRCNVYISLIVVIVSKKISSLDIQDGFILLDKI